MSEEFKLSKLGIDGKELGILYHQSSIKEFIQRLKEEIKRGVDRNDVFPIDWCFDGIDQLAGDLK